MDLLSEMLEGVRLRSFVHGRNEFRAPWGFRVPGVDEALPPAAQGPPPAHVPLPGGDGRKPVLPGGGFYAVTRGTCWLDVLGGETDAVQLRAGDVAILTQGRAHQLLDDPGSKVRPVWEVVPPEHFRTRGGVRYGGGGAVTGLITGGFFFEDRADHRLLSALPPLVHIKGSDGEGLPWLGPLLAVLSHETDQYDDGAQAVINRLAAVLFMQAVRLHARRSAAEDGSASSIAALLDPEIGPALARMHARPEAAWTVASLADAVAMSRSAFAARFASLVGTPPLQYLAACRMRRAAELLRDGHLTARQVAAKVGYGSEAAFSNAFKRKYGSAPAAYRRHHDNSKRQDAESPG